MPIADSIRFQLLDLGKQIIFARDRIAPIFDRLTGLATAKVFEIPRIGSSVEFASGQRAVAGWFVPQQGSPVASVLLFHGIGDHTHYWRRVQLRLAQAGISSLIFSLPGYGGNSGATSPANMEADARAAYALLAARVSSHTPIVLLGFSLGSGLAAQVASTLHPPLAALILLEAFTTLREGAMRAAWPAGFLGYLVPDLWNTRKTSRNLVFLS
jgi:alpha-beta hydrolase superfamily lysophospholipase